MQPGLTAYTRPYLHCIGVPVVGAAVKEPLSPRHGDAAPQSNSEQSFVQALNDALASALTKFDSLEAQFSLGRSVNDVCSIITGELSGDHEFLPFLSDPEKVSVMQRHVRTAVGKSYGEWKKSGGSSSCSSKKEGRTKLRGVFLPWSSIDSYPEWVLNQIGLYTGAEPEERAQARRQLEEALLEQPLHAAAVKYDGTCFGKLDTGELCGRRECLGLCSEYLHTSTAAAGPCDVAALRQRLMQLLAADVAHVCVWGELMCNPNFYGYKERGLYEAWVCFGAVAVLSDATCSAAASQKLTAAGLAHSVSADTGHVRLLLCPALRQLLLEVGANEVAKDLYAGLTHAEAVARAAPGLCEGQEEGLVLVFERRSGQASLRKWKNSAEGPMARQKEAQLLRACRAQCLDLTADGQLDARVADLVGALLRVAEAETSPAKKGRGKEHKKQKG